MKHLFLLFVMLAALAANSQRTDQPWQIDLSAGIHSFYAPVQELKWKRPEFHASAGFQKLLNRKQLFSVGLQLGFSRNNYQGDAIYMQLIGQVTPVIANTLELGFGLGAGYRIGLYPASPLKNKDGNWTTGKVYKNIIQVPVQFSLGYRSLTVSHLSLRPYIAYQLQALLGYNPDLSPLPVSNFSLGMKIHNNKK